MDIILINMDKFWIEISIFELEENYGVFVFIDQELDFYYYYFLSEKDVESEVLKFF